MATIEKLISQQEKFRDVQTDTSMASLNDKHKEKCENPTDANAERSVYLQRLVSNHNQDLMFLIGIPLAGHHHYTVDIAVQNIVLYND